MNEYYENLRQQAERLFEAAETVGTQPVDPEFRRLIHEVGIYQTELELRNEELRNAQSELTAAQERYRSLYQEAPVGYVTLTPDGEVTESNRNARAMMLGLDRLSRGRRMADFVVPPDRLRFQHFLDKITQTPHQCSGEFLARRPDMNGLTEVRMQGSFRRDKDDAVVEVRIALSDVTELKRVQRDLHELAQSLDQRVQVAIADSRKKEAQLRALVAELNMAEQRERRRIAGDLHDYLAQLLVAARLRTANIRRALGENDQSAALKIVEDLLHDGLVYTRTLIGEISPTILFESGLAPALRQLAHSLADHHLNVDVSEVEDVEASTSTRILIYQCVRELLFNALKHSGASEAAIKLQGLDDHIQVVVRDEGRGANLEDIERANPLRDKFGLFSIRERLEAVQGEFFIETSPGNGMTCILEVPADSDAEQAYEPDEEPFHPVEKTPDAIQVLVVDDHTALRQGLVRCFADLEDVSVTGEAGSGTDAIAQAATLHPDAVLMDINLPDINGVEVTRRIKSEQPEIAVIGLSMRNDETIIAQMRAAGASVHLGKDAPIEQIVRHIRKACGRETSGAL